jgi:hypothetical protein
MGIGAEFIDLLGQLRIAGLVPARTSVVEIGAQQLETTFLNAPDALHDLGLLFGIDRPLVLPAARPTYIVHGALPHLDSAAPSAREFWNWLGFTHRAIDIDGSPGSIALDLNYDGVPETDRGKYRLVTNMGTTEHVANQLNAFKIIHELTALSGIMIHVLPAQGMFNHGLFNYNFKFFWMLARSNNYRFIHSNYAQSGEIYGLPENIVGFLENTNVTAETRVSSSGAADAGITLVMQKILDIPFVAPLDVPTGTRTEHEVLQKRYWTVFEPDQLLRAQEHELEMQSAIAARRAARLERARHARTAGRLGDRRSSAPHPIDGALGSA